MNTSSVSEDACQRGFTNIGYSFAERHFEAKIQRIVVRLAIEPSRRISYGRFRQIASSGFNKEEAKEVLEILCQRGDISRNRSYVFVNGNSQFPDRSSRGI